GAAGAGAAVGVRPGVLVGEADDAAGGLGAAAQGVAVVEVPAVEGGAETGDGGGRRVGAGETGHPVPGGDELGDDGAGDVPGCSGDEDVHCALTSSSDVSS